MVKSVRKIGLGTAQFGLNYGISNVQGQTPLTEVRNILEIARQHKVTIIDTASAYGNAENVLGRHDLSLFKVVSKF
jgi:aryl-alcohol dehydrogenase-like predicted oxidoreductase